MESLLDNIATRSVKRNVISFANVAARYEGGPEILSDVSFNISSHSFYFLTGASGAGKTTLLRLIYHLHPQSRGQIKLFDKPTFGIPRNDVAALRRRMAIVFQEYSLISHLSVFDNVALPLRVRGTNESYTKKLVARTLQWVGLASYANTLPLNLSGGQQQRVAVARAIITQPEILLADEPTGNLDDASAAKLMEMFIQMNKNFGTAIILATHSQKLLDTYPFPRIFVEDHKVNFCEAGTVKRCVPPKMPPPLKPREEAKKQSYFAQLSAELQLQFDNIAGGGNK
ncbi:MAG: ATP-binding cassette domain-containing protein [Alphaproteobacteria bacterium]|nr:ATP-binding cassette domain-containing protein [Alphaproteobacteria bacterium]